MNTATTEPTPAPSPWIAVARLLSFRLTHGEFMALGGRHLLFGLGCTWIVGMGRWWDDPQANLAQHLGIGSVAYVFVLSALLWILIAPLCKEAVGYFRVLTFVSMTSPPAILYAIPVERFLELDTAGTLNLWFLAAVALWRILLLGYFLLKLAKLQPHLALIVTFLPLTGIVASLVALNLHHVVFRLMGSIAEHERSAHDSAYGFLILLTVISIYAAPPLLLVWSAFSSIAWNERRKQRKTEGS